MCVSPSRFYYQSTRRLQGALAAQDMERHRHSERGCPFFFGLELHVNVGFLGFLLTHLLTPGYRPVPFRSVQ